MKTQLPTKFFAFILITLGMFFITAVNAQSPITLTYQNFLMPPASTINWHYTEGNIPTPAEGENKTHDYGHQPDVNTFDYDDVFVKPTNPNFLTSRTGWNQPDYYGFTDLFDYLTIYLSIDQQAEKFTGISFAGDTASLESVTGVATDSLWLPAQSHAFNIDSAIESIFPVTYGFALSLVFMLLKIYSSHSNQKGLIMQIYQ
jgi:hypothetical protein